MTATGPGTPGTENPSLRLKARAAQKTPEAKREKEALPGLFIYCIGRTERKESRMIARFGVWVSEDFCPQQFN